MDNEYYSIDVELKAQESEANMDKGNIFLTATMASYKANEQPLVFHRMGHLRHRSSIILGIKQVLSYVPFLSWFINLNTTQFITIPIVESLDNGDYKSRAIELTISQSQIAFNSANIRIKTILYGTRYLMRNWFFTTAFLVVSITGFMIFLCTLAFITAAREHLRPVLFSLYP